MTIDNNYYCDSGMSPAKDKDGEEKCGVSNTVIGGGTLTVPYRPIWVPAKKRSDPGAHGRGSASAVR